MARTFVAASSQYLVQAAAPVTSTPLTLATWIRVANTAAPFKAALSVCSGAGSDHATLYCEGSNLRAQARGGAAGTGATVSGLSAGTWQHAAGVYGSATSKIAYLNGTAGSTETTSYTFGTLDRVAIGVAIQTTPTGEYFDGDIAESAIWNVALTVDEIAALAKGFNPRFIRPASLVAYWPITGNDSPELDRWKSRYDLTLNGTPAKADSPRLIARSRVQVGFGTIVAPPTPNTPVPADASTRQSLTPTLTWLASGATSYDVYFGTAASPPLVSSGQAAASYTPAGPLPVTTKYYWKIVAINSAGSTTGPVWSFTTLNPYEVVMTIASVTPHMRIAGLSIRDLLNADPNTCSFTVDGTAPTGGQEIKIGLGSLATPNLLFGGTIEHVDQMYEGGKASHLAWRVQCRDHTRTFNRRSVRIRYGQQSATPIAVDLVSRYSTGFTSNGVVADLPTVTGGIDLTDEYPLTCLRRLATRIGGYCDVDYGKDVKLFLTDTSTPPDDLVGGGSLMNDPPVTYSVDLSQIRTRVFVEGGGAKAMAAVLVGATSIPVTDADWYSGTGGIVVSGPQRITYTGKGVAGGPAALTAAVSQVGGNLGPGPYSYKVTTVASGVESNLGTVSNAVSFSVNPPVGPAAVAANLAGNLGPGPYTYKTTFVNASGQTLASTVSGPVTFPAVNGATSLSLAASAGGSVDLGNHFYVVTYHTALGDTSYYEASANNVNVAGTNKTVTVTIPTSTDNRVTARKVWRTKTGHLDTPSDYWFVATVNDNTTSSYIDTAADSGLTGNGTIPTSNTTAGGGQASVSSIQTGPTGTTARKVYRPVSGGSTYRLAATINDNTTTTLADNLADSSLGVAEPISNTANGGQMALAGIPLGAGGTTARNLYRTPSGGTVYQFLATIGDNTTTIYTDNISDGNLGASSGGGSISLTGIPATGPGSILYPILAGDDVNILVQCDDVAAQTSLAATEGGDSDGIYEHMIQDRRLSFAEATATGYADLALFSRPIVTIHYASHDPKTRSGKTVHVNLPSLGLVGDWTIQSVTIDQIGIAANTYPRYTVDASSVRFSFESVLRLLALKVA